MNNSTNTERWEPSSTFWEQNPEVYAICKTEWGVMWECYYPYFYPTPDMPEFELNRKHGYYEVHGSKWKTHPASIYPDSVPWDDSLRINPKGDPHAAYRNKGKRGVDAQPASCPVTLTVGANGRGIIVVNGHDLSQFVTRITVDVVPYEPPRVTFHLIPTSINVQADALVTLLREEIGNAQ